MNDELTDYAQAKYNNRFAKRRITTPYALQGNRSQSDGGSEAKIQIFRNFDSKIYWHIDDLSMIGYPGPRTRDRVAGLETGDLRPDLDDHSRSRISRWLGFGQFTRSQTPTASDAFVAHELQTLFQIPRLFDQAPEEGVGRVLNASHLGAGADAGMADPHQDVPSANLRRRNLGDFNLAVFNKDLSHLTSSKTMDYEDEDEDEDEGDGRAEEDKAACP